MAKLDLKSLIGKLNNSCRKALESAAGLCLSHTHYEVDVEHFLLKLLEVPDTDLQKILRYFEVNEGHLIGDLTRAIEEFKTGNARTPALSPSIPKMVEQAWLLASVDYQSSAARSGHVLLALLSNPESARTLTASSDQFRKIKRFVCPGPSLFVIGFRVFFKDFGDLYGKRAVQVDVHRGEIRFFLY